MNLRALDIGVDNTGEIAAAARLLFSASSSAARASQQSHDRPEQGK
jgi:hypothetical protein